MSSYRYRKSHCGDKTVVRSSYLHNGISYTGKMSSLYWIGAQISQGPMSKITASQRRFMCNVDVRIKYIIGSTKVFHQLAHLDRDEMAMVQQMHFLDEKFLIWQWHFTEICSVRSNWQCASTDSDKSLTPIRRQSIIRINNYVNLWHTCIIRHRGVTVFYSCLKSFEKMYSLTHDGNWFELKYILIQDIYHIYYIYSQE